VARTRIVVDAENVRRSTCPNLSKAELVAGARAWAERNDADLLVVFDDDPPETAADIVGSGRRTADDVIAELPGPIWLVTSDRALRNRVGSRAERILGGGSFVAAIQ
jgi:hypothetical protein